MTSSNQNQYWLKVIEGNWDSIGACGSCGWHAAFHEHCLDESYIEDALKDKGDMELLCQNDDVGDDRISHRGVRFNLFELPSQNQTTDAKLDEILHDVYKARLRHWRNTTFIPRDEVATLLDDLYNPSISDLELDDSHSKDRPVVYLDQVKSALGLTEGKQ